MSESGFLAQIGLTGYVLAAYTVTWVVVIGYTAYLRARARRAEAALRADSAREQRSAD